MPRAPLVPEITLALAAKFFVILAAALFVFSPRQRPHVDAASVEARMMGIAPASPHPGGGLP
ncbi:MAG: hypothetical protein L0Y50_09210 [Beijerinckiaceae bacterium]|nr:hypothetical protein [Beijerinckiaceae bacterium]MCI0736432.1 hypothetical protein [Beijerinckiaceae bacterium]